MPVHGGIPLHPSAGTFPSFACNARLRCSRMSHPHPIYRQAPFTFILPSKGSLEWATPAEIDLSADHSEAFAQDAFLHLAGTGRTRKFVYKHHMSRNLVPGDL